MAATQRSLSVEVTDPYDLEEGDIIMVGAVYRQITAVSAVYYDYANLASTGQPINPVAASTERTDTLVDLKPEDNELYYIDAVGIDGPVQVQPFYPQGIPRQTPHNIPQYFDQTQGHKDNPLFVGFWIVPGTQPQMGLNNIYPFEILSDVWFYGIKFKFNIVTLADAKAAEAAGKDIYYAAQSYQ